MVSFERIACKLKCVDLFDDHLIQDRPHFVSGSCTFLHCVYHRYAFRVQVLDEFTAVIETPRRFHVCYSISLDFLIGGLLLDDVDELQIRRVGANAVNNRKGEFAFG